MAFGWADFGLEGGEAPLDLRVLLAKSGALAAHPREFAGEPVAVGASVASPHTMSIGAEGVSTLAENGDGAEKTSLPLDTGG